MYEALKRAKLPFSTEHDVMYSLEDLVLVLLHMCKNETAANRSVTELSATLRDDKNVSIPTSQRLLEMISAIDPDRRGALCRRMLKNTIKDESDLEKRTGQMSATDKHLILLTGADRYMATL